MLTRNKKLKDYGIPAEDIEKIKHDAERLPGRVRIPAYQCRLVSLPEKHGDSGYGYREYSTPEKLQKNQQRKIYPDESEGLLWIQAQDRRCTV